MSENNNPQRPRYSPSHYSRAFDIVRSILDDQSLSHDVSPSGELYRAIERFHRGIENTNMSDNSPSSSTPTGSTPQHPILPPLRSAHWPSRRQSPLSSGGDHMPSRRRTNYLRSRLGEYSPQPANPDFSPPHVFSDWNPHDYAPTINPAHLISPPGPDDYNEDARRIKRRKLDADTYSNFYPAFRYGRYGQVEPGELKMEIVNCDGGLFKDEARYAAENILRDDKSVYCTQGNRCNIMLKHQGSTVFSLKELIIKAPGSDFTAPIREGFVFISMTNDDVLNRTAQFQIQYRTPSRDPDPEPEPEPEPARQDRQPTVTERYSSVYPSSPHVSSLPAPTGIPGGGPLPPLPPMFSTGFGSGSFSRGSASRARVGRLSQLGAEDEENEQQAYAQSQVPLAREAQIPKEFNQDPPPFTVTTEYGNDEDEDGALGGYRRRAPNRIGSLPFERMESDDSDDDGNPFAMDNFEDLARWRRREHNRRRHMHVAESLSPSLAEAAGASQAATLEAVQAVGGNLLAAHAKFCIDKDRNKCTIKFDPPVSGRFILLKIWNPEDDPSGNIDIRAVIAKGFAGPRYFPKVELR